jgi:hypothetical protein
VKHKDNALASCDSVVEDLKDLKIERKLISWSLDLSLDRDPGTSSAVWLVFKHNMGAAWAMGCSVN